MHVAACFRSHPKGSYINNALTTLGVVIFKLSKRKPGHQGKVHIPYRDSNLTWLLKVYGNVDLGCTCPVLLLSCA